MGSVMYRAIVIPNQNPMKITNSATMSRIST